MNYVPQFESAAKLVAEQSGLTFIRFVAHGAFKETFEVIAPDGSARALKLVDRSKINLARTEREIEALRRCDSLHIAKIFDWQSHHDGVLAGIDVVVEEFLSGGTFEAKMNGGPVTRAGAAILGLGLSRALVELHDQRLVHRDIKPANIMFRGDSPEPVLVDFGLVRDLQKESLTQSWMPNGPCTPYYAAPEQLNNEKAMIDWRSDQFSVGVVLIEALLRRHPYDLQSGEDDDVCSLVASRKRPPASLTRDLKVTGMDFLTKLVEPWPVQRFSTPQQLSRTFEDMLE